MRKTLGWFGFAIALVVGLAATAASFWIMAPVVASLWLLVLVLLAAAGGVAALAAHLMAPASLGRRSALVAGAVNVTLVGGLFAYMALSRPPEATPPQPDPRGPHERVRLTTGSEIAVWRSDGEGSARVTPVVYLHGGAGLSVRPRDLRIADGFRRAGFRIVAYDQPGSGASADLPATEYGLARSVADLEALRIAEGADALVVWGQSWGAELAAAYALAHPDRVAGLVAESPGEIPGEDMVVEDWSKTNKGADDLPPIKMIGLYILLARAPNLAEQYLSQDDHRPFMYGFHIAETPTGTGCKGTEPVPFRFESWLSLYTLVRIRQDVEAAPQRSAGVTKVPTLVLRGDCDMLPETLADAYLKAFAPARRVDLTGAGHMLLGQDEAYARELEAFARTDLAAVP